MQLTAPLAGVQRRSEARQQPRAVAARQALSFRGRCLPAALGTLLLLLVAVHEAPVGAASTTLGANTDCGDAFPPTSSWTPSLPPPNPPQPSPSTSSPLSLCGGSSCGASPLPLIDARSGTITLTPTDQSTLDKECVLLVCVVLATLLPQICCWALQSPFQPKAVARSMPRPASCLRYVVLFMQLVCSHGLNGCDLYGRLFNNGCPQLACSGWGATGPNDSCCTCSATGVQVCSSTYNCPPSAASPPPPSPPPPTPPPSPPPSPPPPIPPVSSIPKSRCDAPPSIIGGLWVGGL